MTHRRSPLHHSTPLLPSAPLSAIHGAEVWLKMESSQPVGSFKIRGLGRACEEKVSEGASRLVCSSGGNAGYAVAYAARCLGVSSRIIVPRTTPAGMREKIRSEGATVEESGDSWDDAHAHALTLAGEKGSAYLHPFDEPVVWTGHASLVDEIRSSFEGAPPPGAVVVSVGGGGLLCGLLEGLHRVGWNDVPVVATETEGAGSFAKAVASGELVTLPAIESVATTLGARTVCSRALDWCTDHEILPWLVTDRAAVTACCRFLDDHRVLVEPACGAALAAVYETIEPLRGRGPIVVIVCGGAGASRALLRGWQERLGISEESL